MDKIDPKEMYTDFEEMIDKLRYYAEMCKSGADATDSADNETSEDTPDAETGDGEDPKVSAFALAIKRKMEDAK